MAALSARNVALRTRAIGNVVREVLAATAVYGYSLVMRDSADKIVPLSTAAGVFSGLLAGDNVTTTQTERKVVVSRNAIFLATITSVAITDVGKPVFCATDNPADVSLAQAAGAKRIGRIVDLEYDSNGAVANKCWVELEGEPVASQQIEHVTADRTLLRGESGKVLTNLGAAGAVKITLPQDAKQGDRFEFVVMAAQQLQIDPGAAGAIYINGAKQTDDKYVHADDEGESTTLIADGNGDWISCHTNGTWSVEA